MKTKKKLLLAAAAAAVVVICGVILFFVLRGSGSLPVYLFFIDESGHQLEADESSVKFQSPEEIPAAVIEQLKSGSNNLRLKSPVADGAKVNSVSFDGGDSIIVDFSEEFLTGNAELDVMNTYAVIKSICSAAPYFTSARVKVTAASEPVHTGDCTEIGYVSGSDIKTSPSYDMTEAVQCVLYYRDKTTGALRGEQRNIALIQGENMETTLVKSLIEGPVSEELSRVFDKSTKLISAQTVDGICYVNFRHAPSGENAEAAVRSLVGTLMQLESIEGVRLLAGGKTVASIGSLDTSRILTE